MLELKAFVTNLGKYNEGELIGEWVTFPIDEDEQNDLFMNIGLRYTDEEGEEHNQEYEEYFITDYDCEFNSDFLGEYESIKRLNEVAEKLEEYDEAVFIAACEVFGIHDVLCSDPYDYMLLSGVKDDEALGLYYTLECDCIDIPDEIRQYFNYELYGESISINVDGDYSSKGWIERIN